MSARLAESMRELLGVIEETAHYKDPAGFQDRVCEHSVGARAALAEYDANPRPAAVLHMDGGVIQDVTVSEPMDLMVVDYDCEGTPDDELTAVDQGEGGYEDAVVFFLPMDVGPDYVAGRVARYAETNGEEA